MPKTPGDQHPQGLFPAPASLLSTPLAYIDAEHLRARQICAMIDAVAAAPTLDRRAVQTVLRFLNEDLSDHMRDEAEDLYPLLLRRCPADYEVGQTFERIKVDQDKATRLLPAVRAILARCLDDAEGPAPEEAKTLRRFAAHARRHILAENAILLPLARAHLTRRDLSGLARRMQVRRGLTPHPETHDAE